MGAPKQKWTPDEEAALKAGVRKHGPGKWRTILKDPEFSGVLNSRSNVDLKDKWRNMSVMANGWGSREKARLALKRMNQAHKQEESSLAVTTEAHSDEEIAEARLATTSSGTPQIGGSKRSIIRLDNLIMEAISNLKELGGSNKTTIATYIEMKRKYRIAPMPVLSDRRRIPSVPLLESRQRISSRVDEDDINMLTKAQVDLELTKMSMIPQEAAAAAAQAVAEAEVAIAEAEDASRVADVAEAEAEAAQAFAEAAMKALRGRSTPRTVRYLYNIRSVTWFFLIVPFPQSPSLFFLFLVSETTFPLSFGVF
ncbi:telomere repeat-binding factor 1-like isoform X2 [Lycium ferocissimum]|uniref:telomere repeat-binding factor 1-like isoform X2 n=1 Tax=Lycium ferocissimum TaxID=112874 RepID=UPI0028169799|nr:telomere repeat-binding factor 1-like isoform X2 [Lycium ferocissimum]